MPEAGDLHLDALSQRIGHYQNHKNCGKWCKEVSQHLKNLYRTRKHKLGGKQTDVRQLAKRVAQAHRLIKETPITDRERNIVADYIKKHDSGEKRMGYNYEEDFDKVQVPLCWKEAEHLEEILFTSLFQLKFRSEKERDEAIRANTHSLKTLADACKEIEKSNKADEIENLRSKKDDDDKHEDHDHDDDDKKKKKKDKDDDFHEDHDHDEDDKKDKKKKKDKDDDDDDDDKRKDRDDDDDDDKDRRKKKDDDDDDEDDDDKRKKKKRDDSDDDDDLLLVL